MACESEILEAGGAASFGVTCRHLKVLAWPDVCYLIQGCIVIWCILTDRGNICMAVRDDSQLSTKQWGINTSTSLSQSVLKLEEHF